MKTKIRYQGPIVTLSAAQCRALLEAEVELLVKDADGDIKPLVGRDPTGTLKPLVDLFKAARQCAVQARLQQYRQVIALVIDATASLCMKENGMEQAAKELARRAQYCYLDIVPADMKKGETIDVRSGQYDAVYVAAHALGSQLARKIVMSDDEEPQVIDPPAMTREEWILGVAAAMDIELAAE